MRSEISSTELLRTGSVASLLISLLPVVAFCEPAIHLSLDFVVIGGGSEGSIVAKRLTENPNWNVLISEPKNYGDGSDFYFVEGTNETCLAHRHQRCQWPRLDRNPKLYVRGVPEDYDSWLKKGNQDWGWKQLLPYFKKSIGESGSAHRPESYVTIHEPELYSQDFEVLEKLYLLKDVQSKSHRLNHTAETGFCNLPYIEVRHSEVISRRRNLYVLNYAEPKRINFVASGERVESVTFVLSDKQEINVEVKKELVLAAGAIESAKLLMLSGVGNQQHLTSLHIPVIHNLPVGKNLQNHLTLPLFLSTPILDVIPLEGSSKNFSQGIVQRRGPFGDQGMLALTEFANTVPGNNNKTPDIEYHYFFIKHHASTTLNNWNSFAGLDNYYINGLQNVIKTKNLLIIQSVLTHPKSSGSVELRSANYADSPKISGNYLDNPEDVETLLRSIYYAKNELKTAAFENVKFLRIPTLQCNTKPLFDDSYWRCYMKYMAMPQVNHVGTVKMGPNKNESCVNSKLLVHGVTNLRVADPSIMPDIPSSEINAATLMIAEKAADLIKNYWE